jgi:Fur family transcriptional regulator, ferric uptake regulator
MNSKPSFRITHQRRVILEELKKVNVHPTADEIYSLVRNILPHISLGTVYRNLEILSEKGYVDKLEFGGQRRFDGNRDKHYHIQCLNCGSIGDIPWDIFENLKVSPQKIDQFHVYGRRILFLGVCDICHSKGFIPSEETDKQKEQF